MCSTIIFCHTCVPNILASLLKRGLAMSLSMPRSRSAFVVLFSLLVLLSGPIAMTAPPALQSLRTTTSVIVPSWGGVGPSDVLWWYIGSTWSSIIPPAPGKYWRWIAADPFNPQRWLLLGNSDGSDEFAYGTNGVRMRDGTTPPLWITRDAGATWTAVMLPARGAYFATRLNQVEWSTSTPGMWLIAGYVVGSTWNAASLWRGNLTDTTEFLLLEELQNSRWLELKYAVPGLSNDAVIAEWDSPGSGTAGRLGYQRAGATDLTQSGTGYLFRGLQIDRLPGTSPVVVGVDQGLAGNGAELWATDDYRTSAALRRLVLDEGTWITAARDGVYIGGRSNGVIHVTNPVTAPITQLVAGNGDRIGFVRTDRQTQTGIGALQGEAAPRRMYLRPGDALVWEVIALPSAATAVANRLEVIVTAQAITPTPIPAPTQTPTPIPAPPVQTPPPFTTSYYEGTTNLKIHRQQGCRARDLGEQGIVVLMYGSSRQLGTAKNPVYGAGLFRPRGDPLPQPVNLNDIKAAVRAFADGYYSYRSCRQFGITIPDPTPANLVIAVGTSNSPFLQTGSSGRVYRVLNPALTKEHGAAWARMLIELRRDVLRQGYRGVKIAGAYDAEPDFWSVDRDGDQIEEPVPGPTFDWARGYDAVPDRPEYYNFGSMDGGLRDSSWLSQPSNQRFEQIFELSSGIGAARPLPQMYNWAYAKE